MIEVPPDGCFPSITVRRAEVLAHIVDGYSQVEVASRMHLSVNGIHSHVEDLRTVTGCQSIRELGRWWRSHRAAWRRYVHRLGKRVMPSGARILDAGSNRVLISYHDAYYDLQPSGFVVFNLATLTIERDVPISDVNYVAPFGKERVMLIGEAGSTDILSLTNGDRSTDTIAFTHPLAPEAIVAFVP